MGICRTGRRLKKETRPSRFLCVLDWRSVAFDKCIGLQILWICFGSSHIQNGIVYTSRPMASRSSGKPRCPCERHGCTQLTPRMLEVWKSSEGQKWNWISDTQAYCKFCEECHNRYAWPGDMRCKGPHCKPQPPPWRACAQRGSHGQAPLVSGDFWLTRESPQMPSPEFLRGVA